MGSIPVGTTFLSTSLLRGSPVCFRKSEFWRNCKKSHLLPKVAGILSLIDVLSIVLNLPLLAKPNKRDYQIKAGFSLSKMLNAIMNSWVELGSR